MLLFGESDTASHHFWRFFDRHHPDMMGMLTPIFETPFVMYTCDQAVGRLIESADADVVCICSDHGFGGAGDYALYLNQYSIKGWLTLKRDRRLVWVKCWIGLVGLVSIRFHPNYRDCLEHCRLD